MTQTKKLKGASGLAAALLFICSHVAHSTSASHLQDAVRALRQPVAQSSLEDLHRAAFRFVSRSHVLVLLAIQFSD